MMGTVKLGRRLVLGALLTVGLAGPVAAKDYKTLTIGTEGAYEPWTS